MSRRTSTFEIRTNRPDRVVEALTRQLEMNQSQSALIFVSGALAQLIPELAQGLAASARQIICLILPSVGVLTERGEVEGESAAAVLLLPHASKFWTMKRADLQFGASVCTALDTHPGSTAFVALRTDDNDAGWLEHVGHHFKNKAANIFGGGLLPRLHACTVEDGIVTFGAAAAALLPAQLVPHFRASSACRLISPLRQVTKSRGPVLHELEGMVALDRLNEATSEMTDAPLVLLAIAAGENPLSRRGRSLALRTIQGVDPGRGALIFGEQIPEGARVAFAVRDSRASRQDFQAQVTSLKLECAGSASRFGVFVNCAGRGRGLYGAHDVDLRILKNSFPELPLIGMHSTFELAPLDGRTVPQIYNAVIGLFCAPS